MHPESRYDGEDMSLISIYNKIKRDEANQNNLLSVMVDVVKDGDIISTSLRIAFLFLRRLNSVEGKIGNYTFISIF